MHRAAKSKDWEGILASLDEATTPTVAGCREWKYATSPAGYPVIGQGAGGGLVHRHVMSAVLRRPIGEEPVHHKCANRLCVEPSHLQPTTARENMAEMLHRQFYIGRIAQLEAALRQNAPDHPLLAPPPIGDSPSNAAQTSVTAR